MPVTSNVRQLKGNTVDDELKKLMQEAQRQSGIVPGSLADEIRKLSTNPSIAEFAKVAEASAFRDIVKQAGNLAKLPDLTIPVMPYIEPYRPPKMPTQEEANQFQGASVLLRRLAESIRQWRASLPEGLQPAVIALLNGGIQIDVHSLAQESFHGIRIEGVLNGQSCVVLAHQSTVQLLCIAQPIAPPESPKRSIGFVIDGLSSVA